MIEVIVLSMAMGIASVELETFIERKYYEKAWATPLANIIGLITRFLMTFYILNKLF